MGMGWGRLAPIVGRLASLAHLSAPASNVGSPPSRRFNLRHGSRSVRIKGRDEALPRIHGPIGCLVPPIKGPPLPPPEGHHLQSDQEPSQLSKKIN
jgi:hypothetical protein